MNEKKVKMFFSVSKYSIYKAMFFTSGRMLSGKVSMAAKIE